jgi:type IV pilus assembly protein PilE
MVVLAIMAILTAIAWPAYLESVRKGRRSDAMAGIAQVMQAQERYRSNNSSYAANLSDLSQVSANSTGGYYTLAVSGASASGYTVTATVKTGTPQGSDSNCNKLIAEVSGGSITYKSENANAANGTPDPCWVQ